MPGSFEDFEDRIRIAVAGLEADEVLDLIWYLLWYAHFKRQRERELARVDDGQNGAGERAER